MTILRNIRMPRQFAAAGLVAAALAALLLTACEGGSYAVDIFPEQHYQQSYKSGEPPRLSPHPLGGPDYRPRDLVRFDRGFLGA